MNNYFNIFTFYIFKGKNIQIYTKYYPDKEYKFHEWFSNNSIFVPEK